MGIQLGILCRDRDLMSGEATVNTWYLAPHAAHPKGPKGAKMRIRNRWKIGKQTTRLRMIIWKDNEDT